MKLLRIIGSMNPSSGGPPQGIRNVTEELLKKGIQTTVVSLDAPESSFLEDDSFQTIALGPVKTPVAYTEKLKPFLKEYVLDYDVVIIHGLWLYHSFVTIQVVRSYRRKGIQTPKVYIMPHGMLDPWFQRAPSRRWKALRNEVYWALVERQV
ncbi:MAG: glycosyl transferase family 1, partial [Spirosomataceae bacterium]